VIFSNKETLLRGTFIKSPKQAQTNFLFLDSAFKTEIKFKVNKKRQAISSNWLSIKSRKYTPKVNSKNGNK
jgi:hypothetical protein